MSSEQAIAGPIESRGPRRRGKPKMAPIRTVGNRELTK
jgi:hypothetical protein